MHLFILFKLTKPSCVAPLLSQNHMQIFWTMANHNLLSNPLLLHTNSLDCKSNNITMTLCWQTDPYVKERKPVCVCVCVSVCMFVCTYALYICYCQSTSLEDDNQTICSAPPLTLPSHLMSAQGPFLWQQTWVNKTKQAYWNSEHDTTKEERSGVSCQLFPLTLTMDICLTSEVRISWKVIASVSIKM